MGPIKQRPRFLLAFWHSLSPFFNHSPSLTIFTHKNSPSDRRRNRTPIQTITDHQSAMLLGKRSRPPMKRTTSMTEFTLDLSIGFGGIDAAAPPQPAHTSSITTGEDPRFLNSTLSPRPHRRNSADFQIETAHFLRACFLCKRRLIPGRDIYMYKGDSAFCSLECRQQQMTRDDRKDKFSLLSAPSSAVAASGGNLEIVSAAAQVESIAAAAV